MLKSVLGLFLKSIRKNEI